MESNLSRHKTEEMSLSQVFQKYKACSRKYCTTQGNITIASSSRFTAIPYLIHNILSSFSSNNDSISISNSSFSSVIMTSNSSSSSSVGFISTNSGSAMIEIVHNPFFYFLFKAVLRLLLLLFSRNSEESVLKLSLRLMS
jgi:hypothetical protein